MLNSRPAEVAEISDRGFVLENHPQGIVVFDPEIVDAGSLERAYDFRTRSERFVAKGKGVWAMIVNGEVLR